MDIQVPVQEFNTACSQPYTDIYIYGVYFVYFARFPENLMNSYTEIILRNGSLIEPWGWHRCLCNTKPFFFPSLF